MIEFQRNAKNKPLNYIFTFKDQLEKMARIFTFFAFLACCAAYVVNSELLEEQAFVIYTPVINYEQDVDVCVDNCLNSFCVNGNDVEVPCPTVADGINVKYCRDVLQCMRECDQCEFTEEEWVPTPCLTSQNVCFKSV